MTKAKLLKLAISGGWATLIAVTAGVYLLPLIPFKPTLLLILGVANGRYLARWI